MSEPKTPGEIGDHFAHLSNVLEGASFAEFVRKTIADRDEMWRAECSQIARNANDLGRQLTDMERTHVSKARLREVLLIELADAMRLGLSGYGAITSAARKLGIDLEGTDG